jgi:hypothetical protein
MTSITLLDLLHHRDAFRPWFRDEAQWGAWRAFLAALYGLPMSPAELALYQTHTGRSAPPSRQAREAYMCCGVRSGKSLILSGLAVTVGCTLDCSQYIVPGETLKIPVIASDKEQAGVIMGYIREMLNAPTFRKELKREVGDCFELHNGLVIQVHAASFRGVRGFTAPLVLCDEIAFWMNSETSANPDVEILRALRPRMATIPNSILLCASSPYSKKGSLYSAFKSHFGKDGDVLFWKAPTEVMHPPDAHLRSIIDEAYQSDPESASAEFGGEFRDGISDFISREIVEALVDHKVIERPFEHGHRYVAFVDAAGGSGGDSFTLGIAHKRADGVVLVDFLREWGSPFSPANVVVELAEDLKRYGLRSCKGDRYAAEFAVDAFRANGITLEHSELTKSAIYGEMLPLINSGKARLLDNRRAINQLCALERKTSRSGKDSIDHPPRAHDDLANALCGAAVHVADWMRSQSGVTPLSNFLAVARWWPGKGMEDQRLERRDRMHAMGRHYY